jgi:hypothetical protein
VACRRGRLFTRQQSNMKNFGDRRWLTLMLSAA